LVIYFIKEVLSGTVKLRQRPGAVRCPNYAHAYSGHQETLVLLHRTHLLMFLNEDVFGSLTQSE